MTEPQGSSRRDFLKTTAVVGGAAAASGVISAPAVHAAGDDAIRVGLIGCGGRGRGAAANVVESAKGVKIVAMADAFRDQIDKTMGELSSLGGAMDVGKRVFSGLDAYKELIACDEVNYVILATPPGFRPDHIEATINAGKNLFTEKPVGVDGPGIRRVLASYEKAKEKNLAVVAGTQRRHSADYLEAIERIRNGEIGKLLSARVYWNQGGLWKKDHDKSWSDAEWQIRNWLYFSWLSGDHICEQHVHNLDVMNWVLDAHPTSASGMGGREVRTDSSYGHIFDHFAIEYSYNVKDEPVTGHSYCRQIEGCEGNVSETIIGSEGQFTSTRPSLRIVKNGKTAWRYRGKLVNPYVQEHTDNIAGIRAGRPLNELKTVAESTLTAIMGRMATYTGKTITWEEALNSSENLRPANLALDSKIPIPAVAVPGQTKFV